MNTRLVFPPLLLCLLTGCEGRSPVEPAAYKTPVPESVLYGTIMVQTTERYIPFVAGSVTVEQWGISHSTRTSVDGAYRIAYRLQPGKAFVSIAPPTGYVPILESIELFPGMNAFNRSFKKSP